MALGLEGIFDQASGFVDVRLDSQDIVQFVGFDPVTWQHLLLRRLVDFTSVKSGKRTFRQFALATVPGLVLAADLQKAGLGAAESIRAAAVIAERVSEVIRIDGRRPNDSDAPLEYLLWDQHRREVGFSSGKSLFGAFGLNHISRIVIPIPMLRTRIRMVLEACVAAHTERVSLSTSGCGPIVSMEQQFDDIELGIIDASLRGSSRSRKNAKGDS
jgi:hypothetical protein